MIINKYIIIALIAVALLVMGQNLYRWYNPEVVVQKEYVPLKEKIDVPKKEIPVKKLVVLDKEKAVKKLKDLPEAVRQDENKQITATAVVDPYEGKTSVVAVTDIEKGTTELLAKREPLPLISLKPKFEVGASYMPIHSERLGQYVLDVAYQFGRVWKINGEAKGEIDEKGNWRAGVRASVRW